MIQNFSKIFKIEFFEQKDMQIDAAWRGEHDGVIRIALSLLEKKLFAKNFLPHPVAFLDPPLNYRNSIFPKHKISTHKHFLCSFEAPWW